MTLRLRILYRKDIVKECRIVSECRVGPWEWIGIDREIRYPVELFFLRAIWLCQPLENQLGNDVFCDERSIPVKTANGASRHEGPADGAAEQIGAVNRFEARVVLLDEQGRI
jgi:hypothetical protein